SNGIAQLDVERPQVLVEALIMEVDITDGQDLGFSGLVRVLSDERGSFGIGPRRSLPRPPLPAFPAGGDAAEDGDDTGGDDDSGGDDDDSGGDDGGTNGGIG